MIALDLYLHYSEGSLAREKYLAQKEEYRLERLSSESRLVEYRFYFIPIFEDNFKCFGIVDINFVN